MAIFAEQLERIRMERGWTQAQIAASIGIRQNHYSMLVRGCQSPSMRTMQKIKRAFPEVSFFVEEYQERVIGTI